jgi:hypothetical protein
MGRKNHMNAIERSFGVLLLCCAGAAGAAEEPAKPAPDTSDIANIIHGGTAVLNFRYRYEYVDEDPFTQNAHASTLRSRLTLQSGAWRGFQMLVEGDNVSEFWEHDFNAGEGNTPQRTQFPVVADPEGSEINQAYIDYKGFAKTNLRLGRQRINLDNQRFVGGAAWRQNEQTFDALVVTNDRAPLHLFYAYVDHVERTSGSDVPTGDQDQDKTHLVNVRGDIPHVGALTGYYYYIDNADVVASSNATAGLRLTGLKDLASFKVRYAAEFSRQEDTARNPVSYDANYMMLEGAAIVGAFDVGLFWETLGGDADHVGEAFRTPFASFHPFNGWVDKFVTTPREGLDDKYVKSKATFGNSVFEVHYHVFEGADGGNKLGDEWDFLAGYQFHKRFRAELILGNFDGSDVRYQDTLKAWLQLTAGFP